MMHNKYKSAFGHVAPSESSVERIFDMTKKKRLNLKPLLVAAIITALSVVTFVSVNAATDGAVVKEVKQAVQTVRVFVNGEEMEIDPEEFSYAYSKDIVAGEEIDHFEIEVANGKITFDVEPDGASTIMEFREEEGAEGEPISEFRAIVNNGEGEIELNVPTTSVVEE